MFTAYSKEKSSTKITILYLLLSVLLLSARSFCFMDLAGIWHDVSTSGIDGREENILFHDIEPGNCA